MFYGILGLKYSIQMIFRFLINRRSLFYYGLSLALLLLLLQWLEWRFLIIGNAFEIYAGLIALLFTLLGIWLAGKLTKPKAHTLLVEKQVLVKEEDFVVNQAEISRLGISARELEVLGLMAEGLSNQQIAEKLFVSLNTIKTHCSNLFSKLGVQRRTQAVETARKLGLIL